MIPPRRLSGENCGNGVSYRVAVCRKRLRVNRTTPRAASNSQMDEQSRPLHGGVELIPAPRPNTYSPTSPSIALERRTLSRKSEFADPARALAKVAPVEVGAEEKAEDA
jgi:hypothetical protein